MSIQDTAEAVAQAEKSRPRAKNLRLWQLVTIALLVAGYAGYYLCRSDLSVTLPLISGDFVSRGLDPVTVQLRLGSMASLGVLAYALAKFLSGSFADFFGGRRS